MTNGSKQITLNGRTYSIEFMYGTPWCVTAEVVLHAVSGHTTQRTLWLRNVTPSVSKTVAAVLALAA